MPLRYQRRIRIAQGVSLNLNKHSISTTIGRSGARFTIGPKGTRTTFGIPGTGLSYITYRRSQSGTAAIIVITVIVLGLIFRLT